jgi:hypothetical protein
MSGRKAAHSDESSLALASSAVQTLGPSGACVDTVTEKPLRLPAVGLQLQAIDLMQLFRDGSARTLCRTAKLLVGSD